MEVYIKNYNQDYSINKNGIVFSLKKDRKQLSISHTKNGYCQVELCINGIRKKHLLHRLVAESFISNELNKPQVNHIDGNKKNNSVLNLEWCTRSENQLHSINLGLRTTKGEKNSQSKLNEIDVLNIFNDKRMYKYISEQYNISMPTISDIKRGYSWTHITKLKNIKKDQTESNY